MDAVKNAWVERVLGVEFGNADAASPVAPISIATAAQAWRAASDAVDDQISALQSALRGTDDADLHEIGEYGLNAITGNFKVRLIAALRGAEGGNEGDRAKLAAIVPGLRQHLETDERVEACDENPFGVALSIRATLIPALDQLERSLAA